MQKTQRNFGRFGARLMFFFGYVNASSVNLSLLTLELCRFQLDDTIVKSIETAPNDELKKAKEIIQRIRRRQLYKVAVLSVAYLFYYFFLSFLSGFSQVFVLKLLIL
jgi:hypothetical protein